MELLSQFLNLWQALELGIFRKSINLWVLSFLSSNYRLQLSISIVFHWLIFLVVNIVIYVHQLYNTTGTGLAKCLWPPLISWAWLPGLDQQICSFIFGKLFLFLLFMSSAVEDKQFNYVTLLSAPIPASYFLIMRKSEISGLYISWKGMVIFLMTGIRLNARFKFYHAGFREAQPIYFYPFLSTHRASFHLYVVSASKT